MKNLLSFSQFLSENDTPISDLDKMPKSNVKPISKEEWNKTHIDYKTEINGQKFMMVYDDSRDATILIPVKIT